MVLAFRVWTSEGFDSQRLAVLAATKAVLAVHKRDTVPSHPAARQQTRLRHWGRSAAGPAHDYEAGAGASKSWCQQEERAYALMPLCMPLCDAHIQKPPIAISNSALWSTLRDRTASCLSYGGSAPWDRSAAFPEYVTPSFPFSFTPVWAARATER